MNTVPDLVLNHQLAHDIGQEIAHQFEDRSQIDAIAIWDDTESAVLGHVVAQRLEVSIVRVSQVEGLVELIDEIRPASTVALVVPRLTTIPQIAALQTVLKRAACTAVIAGCAEQRSDLEIPSDLPPVVRPQPQIGSESVRTGDVRGGQ